MVNKVNIERECQHKILIKEDLVLIITAVEFINDINELDNKMKFAATNVSVINDNDGPQLGKIVGMGDSIEAAYKDCLDNFNKNKNFFEEENRILLCCSEIPYLVMEDLNDFNMTRTFKFSWRYNDESFLLKAYVRNQNDNLIYIFDGYDECRIAKTDREIIEYILANYDFERMPDQINNKRRGKLFYPTRNEFLR